MSLGSIHFGAGALAGVGSRRRGRWRRASAAGFWLACAVAGVWVYHGLYNKLLGGEPRHLVIVQSVPGLGGSTGAWTLGAIGLAELALAAWIVSGRGLRWCAATQTVFLLTMNAAELIWAREHLLWPAGLVPVNLAFLGATWLSAEMRRGAPAPGLYMLRRHPFAVRAWFGHSLVLTFAFRREVLEPLLPPGLELDTCGDWGFVAAAMVQTRGLRPARLPEAFGRDFFLTGYRIFVKYRTPAGRTLRGLRILRSDADRRLMVIGGNLLTHYNYRKCRAVMTEKDGRLEIRIDTPGRDADVDVAADLSGAAGELPEGSVFRTVRDARRFAGPLPWTFDYEPQTHSIVAIKGVRENWRPRLVPVDVREMSFFGRGAFRDQPVLLASAFHVRDIAYRWERGIRYELSMETP